MKLVELIVVIVTIAMLSSLVVANLPKDLEDSIKDLPKEPTVQKVSDSTAAIMQNGQKVTVDLDTGEVITK